VQATNNLGMTHGWLIRWLVAVLVLTCAPVAFQGFRAAMAGQGSTPGDARATRQTANGQLCGQRKLGSIHPAMQLSSLRRPPPTAPLSGWRRACSAKFGRV